MSDEQTTNDERTVNEERALTEALTVIDGGASAPNAVLKSITITGFKSMLPKTTLEFAPGITAIIGPNGSGKCARGTSLVTLADGTERTIRDLVDAAITAGTAEPMDDGVMTRSNPEGVHVLTLQPESLRLGSRPVTAFVRRSAPATLLRITTRAGREVTVTPYHPLFTLRDGQLSPLRADETRIGTRVALPRQLPIEGDKAALPLPDTLAAFEDRDGVYLPASDPLREWAEGGHAAAGSWGKWARAAGVPMTRVSSLAGGGSVAVAVAQRLGAADDWGPTVESMNSGRGGVTVRVPEALTPDLARFLGLIVAEGDVDTSLGTVRFPNSDPAMLDDFIRLGAELFGLRPYRRDVSDTTECVYLFSKALVALLDRRFDFSHEQRSAGKVVPRVLFPAPEHVQWAFLSGLFEGDAHVSYRARGRKTLAYIEYATASEVLARGVAGLLLRLGIFASVSKREKYATNTIAQTRGTYYSVYIYGNEQLRHAARQLRFVGAKQRQLDRLASLRVAANPNIDIVPGATQLVADAARRARVNVKKHRKGRSKLAAYTERRCEASRGGLLEVTAQIEQLGEQPEAARGLLDRLDTLATSDVYWDTVAAVEEIAVDDEWVYDLCVDETHNFVADNVIVHNSNVADAIRWALGENNARILRAKRNDELIFAGSETRRGTGMAEVTLQLDNSSRRLPVDFTELEVGRRLFKSGEAEYLVNRSRVRLRDLQDLLAGANLADNPFVVIGQGLVDQVLALRPSDRRTVIEEAAGTRRLHLRREEALNRLKSADVELVRVIDILREIGPRVALLEDQAGKWTEYEVLRNELRRRALRWYRSSFGETATARADLVAKLQSVEREIERLADYVTEGEGITAGTDDELRLAREEEERRRLGAADAVAAESGLRERIAALQAATEAAVAERDRTRSVLATLPAEAAGLRQRRTTVDEEAAAAARQAREAADRARSAEEDASRTRVALAEAQAARVEAERARLMRESEESRLTEDERALLERDEELAAAAATLAGQRGERERERERVALELSRARDAANELDSEVEALAAGAGSARNDLQRVEGDLALLRGQTSALEEATSRAVAELAAREGGTAAEPLPPGLAWLHDRLNIPPQLRDAVAQALGDAVALAPGDSLVEQPARRDLTLLVPSVAEDEPAPEGTRRLADLLTLDDDVRRVAGALLRNVFIAKDMRAPFTAARTMQRGIVVGPGVVATPGVLRLVAREDAARDAVRQLRGMSGRLREELDASRRALDNTIAERDTSEARLRVAESRLAEGQRERGARERVVDDLASREADVRDLVRAHEARATAVERERADLVARRERLQGDRAPTSLASSDAAARHRLTEEAERAAAEAHAAASARAEEARLDSATSEERRASHARLRDALDEQVSATERRVADEEERLRALMSQERETRARLDAAHGDLGTAQANAREALRSAELARERALAAEGSRRESEQRLAKSRERLAELRGERSKLAVEEERASGALRLLEEQVRAELGLPDDEPLPDPASLDLGDDEDADERASTMRELQRLRRRLIALEPVNPLAATELAEIGERHRFLASQRADLEKAMQDLRSLADELATAIAEQFSATFQAVDREFANFFAKLFGGGQASLRTSEDPDEPGIDIYARPPGKRLGSLQQLSGGERALTATALLLAILRVKPAPFCVLDEVDAALDERNVGRFTQALRELTDRTQFVVITHNRTTIEAADTLYGVSMDEGGVSKVISLRLSELDQRVG